MSEDALPSINFVTFVLSLSHSARVHLGEVPLPETETISENLVLARQTIDLLVLIEEKTRGNLTGEEELLLGQTLDELRARYRELSRR